jgi:hypothetical protein
MIPEENAASGIPRAFTEADCHLLTIVHRLVLNKKDCKIVLLLVLVLGILLERFPSPDGSLSKRAPRS